MRGWAFLVLVAMNLGCSTLTKLSARREWIEITTSHSVLRTELPRPAARDLANAYERTYAALEAVAFPYAHKPNGRTTIVVFRTHGEYHQFGEFDRPSLADALSLTATTLLLNGESPWNAIAVQSEVVHRLVRFYFPGAPAWVVHGLSYYYSRMDLKDGEAIVGKQTFVMPTQVWPGRAIQNQPVMTVQNILDSKPLDYLSARGPGLPRDPGLSRAYHAGAWALVHLLRDPSSPYSAPFAAYLDILGSGANSLPAFRDAFAGFDMNQLEEDYLASITSLDVPVQRIAYRPQAVTLEHERIMGPEEVHLMFAALRTCMDLGAHEPGTPALVTNYCDPSGDATGLARARADVRASAAIAPRSPEVLLWRARLAAHDRNIAEAERLLREAIAARPNEERYILELFRLLRAEANHTGSIKDAEIDAALSRLKDSARSAGGLDSIARHLLGRGRLDAAWPFATDAVAADLGCAPCYDTAAALSYARGDAKAALRMQTIALNLTPDRFDKTGMVQRWQTYVAAAAPPHAQ